MNPSTIRQSAMTVFRPKLVLWAVVVFAVGAFLGWRIAYIVGAPDYGFGRLGAYFIAALAGTIVATLVVVGVVAALWPGKRDRSAARAAIGTGLLLAAGVGVGWAITPALGLGYREPVLLEARGTMNVSLDGLDGYVGQGDGPARCDSVRNAEGVALVEANSVGRVGTSVVAASVTMVPDGSHGRPVVRVGIVPAVKDEGTTPPTWQGPANVVEWIDGGRAGRIVFTGADLIADEAGRPPEGWPAELSGTLSWSCGAWVRPGASE